MPENTSAPASMQSDLLARVTDAIEHVADTLLEVARVAAVEVRDERSARRDEEMVSFGAALPIHGEGHRLVFHGRLAEPEDQIRKLRIVFEGDGRTRASQKHDVRHQSSFCCDERGCDRCSSSDADAGASAAAHGMRKRDRGRGFLMARSALARVAARIAAAATHQAGA